MPESEMLFHPDCPAYTDIRIKYLLNYRSTPCDRETAFVAIMNDETLYINLHGKVSILVALLSGQTLQ